MLQNACISLRLLGTEQNSVRAASLSADNLTCMVTSVLTCVLTCVVTSVFLVLAGPTVAVAASFNGMIVWKTSPSINFGSAPEYNFVYL